MRHARGAVVFVSFYRAPWRSPQLFAAASVFGGLCSPVGGARLCSARRFVSGVLCRETVTWVSAEHLTVPCLTRHSTPPLWVWPQWVGESVSCTQDRPGYSRVAPPHSLLRSLLIAQRGRRRTERRRRRREAGDRCGCGGRGSGRTRVGGATGSGSGRRRWGRGRGGC